jgi:hypothetical protein
MMTLLPTSRRTGIAGLGYLHFVSPPPWPLPAAWEVSLAMDEGDMSPVPWLPFLRFADALHCVFYTRTVASSNYLMCQGHFKDELSRRPQMQILDGGTRGSGPGEDVEVVTMDAVLREVASS